MTLLYGKFEAKGSQLNNIKIHLPLFGHYLSLQDPLEKILCILQQEGIFLQSSHNAHQGKISFQITSNDWELLQIFAYWYKEIENFSQITKKGQTAQIIEQLLIFLQQEHIENAAALETLFKESVVKLLVK